MAIFCPYCNEEIGKAVYHTWTEDFLNWFEMKCPKCRQMLEIDVEHEPTFLPHKKSERKKHDRTRPNQTT